MKPSDIFKTDEFTLSQFLTNMIRMWHNVKQEKKKKNRFKLWSCSSRFYSLLSVKGLNLKTVHKLPELYDFFSFLTNVLDDDEGFFTL